MKHRYYSLRYQSQLVNCTVTFAVSLVNELITYTFQYNTLANLERVSNTIKVLTQAKHQHVILYKIDQFPISLLVSYQFSSKARTIRKLIKSSKSMLESVIIFVTKRRNNLFLTEKTIQLFWQLFLYSDQIFLCTY